MAKTLGILRGGIRRLDKELENPAEAARAKVRTMEVKRINLVSLCRTIVGRTELPLAARQEAWIKKMAAYTHSVRTSRDEALDNLKKSYDDAETILLQLSEFSEHRPKPEKWPEFQALSPSIREEIEELAKESPSKISEMYARAERLEDSITCFAIERFGPKAISAAQEELGAVHPDRLKFGTALKDLNELIDNSSPERTALKLKAQAIQKDLTAAEQILRGYVKVKAKQKDPTAPEKYVRGAMLPSEELDIRKRFRIDMHDGLSALDLECGIGYISQGDGHLARQLRDDELHNRPFIKGAIADKLPSGSVTGKVEGQVRKLEAKID
ncbi:MAG: hypothetical protein KAV87_00465 [Desulfobacteraceae bacterium]|nr:hypothetical protein [Desulfobacteraceae bacterium]